MIRGIVTIVALLILLFGLSMAPYIWPEKFDRQSEIVQKLPEAQHVTTTGNDDVIRVISPKPGETVTSKSVTIKGYARGMWFFEGSFPVIITNWDGLIIGEGIASADGEWMTTEYVPFEAVVDYDLPEDTYSKKGTIILKKDNPSDDPKFDDALEFDIVFP